MSNEMGLRAVSRRYALACVLALSLAQMTACESSGDPIDFEHPELLEEEDGETSDGGGPPSDTQSDGGTSSSEGSGATSPLLIE